MARGKRTCRILKDIRRQIAEANEIEFVTSECRYRGDCLGTCPKCEAEVRYLEEQLRARSLAGKAIALAGLSAGMLLFSGCSPKQVEATTDIPALEGIVDVVEEICSQEDTITEEIPEQEEIPPQQVTELLRVGEDGNYDDDEECEVSANNDDENNNIAAIDVTQGVNGINKEIVVGEIELDPNTQHPDSAFALPYCDIKPEFPGGEAAMYKWISENIKYPPELIEQGIEGRVVAEFIIERDGSVSNIKLLRVLHPLLDKEAVRLIKSMPAWTPGTVDGNPVRVTYTLPVTFRLPAAEE